MCALAIITLFVAILGWLVRDYRRYLRYRHSVALMLADVGLDPEAFEEAETRRIEGAVRRCYMRRKPASLAAVAALSLAGHRCPIHVAAHGGLPMRR